MLLTLFGAVLLTLLYDAVSIQRHLLPLPVDDTVVMMWVGAVDYYHGICLQRHLDYAPILSCVLLQYHRHVVACCDKFDICISVHMSSTTKSIDNTTSSTYFSCMYIHPFEMDPTRMTMMKKSVAGLDVVEGVARMVGRLT